MRHLPAFVLAPIMLAMSQLPADAFSLSFEWGDIPLCTTGHPGTVPSPAFTLTGLPRGTTGLRFKLVDLDVPGFNHGGGTVAAPASNTVPFGAFTYKSPCPPRGSHTYEWSVLALDANGEPLAVAKAKKDYP